MLFLCVHRCTSLSASHGYGQLSSSRNASRLLTGTYRYYLARPTSNRRVGMSRFSLLALPFISSVVSLRSSAICLPEYETTYVVSTAQGPFTYNLSALCSPAGYTLNLDGTNGYTIDFNIGGDSPTACTPDFPAYNSRGAVVQTLATARPQPRDCVDPTCHDWDEAAALRCCDAPCYVLATDWLSFSLLTPAAPATSGFRIDYPPAADLSDDIYPCAPLPAPNTLLALRTAAIEVTCDLSAGPGLQDISFTEVSVCNYVIKARSANACPLALPPTPSPSWSPTATASLTVSATGTATSTPTFSATTSATFFTTTSSTLSATPSQAAAPPAAAAAAPIVSALDRDAGLFLGGSIAGVAVALISVALSMRGYCDCFRSGGGSGEGTRLLGEGRKSAFSGGA